MATTITRYGGQIHAFFTLPGMLPAAVPAQDEAIAVLAAFGAA